MTYWHSSASMSGEISPVNAPCSSKYIFWAASPILAGPMASRTAASAVKGGPSTTSTFFKSITPRRTPRVSSTASAMVLCIFQLPAMIGVRIKSTPLMWVSVARILPHTPTSGNVPLHFVLAQKKLRRQSLTLWLDPPVPKLGRAG